MKQVGSRRYVHRSALSQLPARDQQRVAALSRQLPNVEWTVARVSPEGIMLGVTTSWDRSDHPMLLTSITLTGDQLRVRSYTGNARPIYHRCETMLLPTHPRYAYFARLTAREERKGWLSRPDIGTVGSWSTRAR